MPRAAQAPAAQAPAARASAARASAAQAFAPGAFPPKASSESARIGLRAYTSWVLAAASALLVCSGVFLMRHAGSPPRAHALVAMATPRRELGGAARHEGDMRPPPNPPARSLLPPATLRSSAGTATTKGGASRPVSAIDGCLITKWSSFWLVGSDRRRRYVAFPSARCEELLGVMREEDDPSRFAKADGEGSIFELNQAESHAACALTACAAHGRPSGKRMQAAAGGGGGGGGGGAGGGGAGGGGAGGGGGGGGVDLPTPVNGWGQGPTAGWMASSALRFNGAARDLAQRPLPAGQPLLLVFGGASVSAMLRNWVEHVRRLDMPFVVTW